MVRESEQQYWMYVTPLCMTEESDDSDSDKIITHKLLWRSDCEKHGSHIRVYTLPIPVCMLRFHTRFLNFHSHFLHVLILRGNG